MRPLPIHSPTAEPAVPAYRATADDAVYFAAGFHGEETAQARHFRWMALRGRLEFAPREVVRYLELPVLSHFHDLSQHLAVTAGPARETLELIHGWDTVSVPVPPGARAVELELDKPYPPAYYPADERVLGVQVRRPFVHADAGRHAQVSRQHANAAANVRETLEGRVALGSRPRLLGLDMEGACNVKPPCVYCAWDVNKALEGANVGRPFTLETLGEYGEFFEDATQLVNCSIGEPFMMRDFDPLLEAFGRRGKVVEITTNGQILTEGNIQRLLGRDVRLYISLDAATPETYARLRSPAFDRVVANVRRLVAAKGGRGRPPSVYLVFMPMRANAHEAAAFVRLCAQVGVDRLILRPLNDSEGLDLRWDRAGYRFEYQKELLPFPERVRVSGLVAELCRRLGVDLSDQMDFGGSLAGQFPADFAAGRAEAAALLAEPAPIAAAAGDAPRPPLTPGPAAVAAPPRVPDAPAAPAIPAALPPLGDAALPACTEPWSSLYILRRGVMPCCYGGAPIAPMDAYREAWNGPLLQSIRRELRAGRFHTYCLDSPDCPIVRKSEHAHALPAREQALLKGRRLWHRWARAGFGAPGRAYRAAKRVLLGRR